jgi:hypothetical protein
VANAADSAGFADFTGLLFLCRVSAGAKISITPVENSPTH